MVDGLFWREEARLDAVVHITAFETDPVARPSCVFQGVIAVPFSWE